MRLAVPWLLVLALLGGCGDDTVPMPPGVSFQLGQTRQDLQGRRFAVQVVNDGRKDLTVHRVELESGRLDEPADYDGPTTVAAGTAVNLTMSMPRARCWAITWSGESGCRAPLMESPSFLNRPMGHLFRTGWSGVDPRRARYTGGHRPREG